MWTLTTLMSLNSLWWTKTAYRCSCDFFLAAGIIFNCCMNCYYLFPGVSNILQANYFRVWFELGQNFLSYTYFKTIWLKILFIKKKRFLVFRY
jgi:hypothetical protein